jgi:hypothetical protein
MHGRSLSISGSQKLRSIMGLKNVECSLPGSLVIESMDNLVTLRGLEGISTVGKDRKGEHSVVVAFSAKLRSIKALEKASFDIGTNAADGMLWLEGNPLLTCTPEHWPTSDQKSNTVPHGECDDHLEL